MKRLENVKGWGLTLSKLDIVQKRLHFHAPRGVELSVRPNHEGGVSFDTPFSKYKQGDVEYAVKEANQRFSDNPAWRDEIRTNAAKGKHLLTNDYNGTKLEAAAKGRAAELHFVEKAVNNHDGCG